MDGILIQAAQLILSLSILVVLHELGHFIPAKLFGVRVEKFYLFFDPWFSLFKKKKGDTEYGVGWLPLGGYVKLSGMIDESMDKEQLSQPAKEYEFRSKPAWQRLIIMVGGVVVNLLLGMLIYAMVLFTWGKTFIAANDAKYGVHVTEALKEMGFKDGDAILRMNDRPLEADVTYGTIAKELMLNSMITNVTVVNEGEERIINIPPDFAKQVMSSGAKGMFTERIPFIVDTVLPGSVAEAIGIQKGDFFERVNGKSAHFFMDFVKILQEETGNEVSIELTRNDALVSLQVSVPSTGKIGIGNKSPNAYFDITQRTYSFFEAIPAGINEALRVITGYIDQFKLVFTKEGASQLGGFGAIGGMFPKAWDWSSFWSLTAFLSLILAFMNILPIPALDGGHVMFLVYEMVSGRKPNEKVLEYAQMAGMLILFSLLIFANGNDILRLFK